MQKHLDILSICEQDRPAVLDGAQVERAGSVELKSASGPTNPAMERWPGYW